MLKRRRESFLGILALKHFAFEYGGKEEKKNVFLKGGMLLSNKCCFGIMILK